MINRYKYIESIINDSNPHLNGLSVASNNSALLRLFRLLSGTIKVIDEFESKTYFFRTNYFQLPFSNNKRWSQKCIIDNFGDDITLPNISELFKKCRKNNGFYGKIEAEVLNCLVARKQERYLESFLFIYRILEGISYSIPLIYTSKSKNYHKSFQALQKYISKSSSNGELSFFKLFITEIYHDEPFFNSTIDIDISLIDIEELREKYYSLYLSKIKDEKHISDQTEDEEIQITYIGFFHFMIELRNRYFHFLQGTWQNNIETSAILHPDLFFKPIVDLGINWVSILFFEIIRFDFEQVHETS